jgi:threonyl-tRNA synthetase
MDKNTLELQALRHSLAHILANSVQHIWPNAKFGVGPVVDNGFYYDIDLGENSISEDDFATIEKEMRAIVKADEKFVQFDLPIEEAITWAKDSDQTYKIELLNDLKRSGTTNAKDIKSSELGISTATKSKVEEVSFYRNGDFTDLCLGPHAESTGKTGSFKLMKTSGVYWRGKDSNPQMQRIYGVAFKTDEELKTYLKKLEESKARDHRKLGQELDLFVISDLVGAGLPMFTPRGTVLREELNRFSQELREKQGYQKVWVPHIAKQQLYEISGHWAKFGDEWLKVTSQETSDQLVMKPMNCPHHQQIYASRPRSYRDLPLKYMETTTVYRDEKAGELLGLSRVRAVTQDDSHTFCTPEQIHEVLTALIKISREFFSAIDLPYRVRLSFRDDSDNYLGDKELWDNAQKLIKDVVKNSGLEYYEAYGEAAFYGPKIDFMAEDALGRELQLATPQLDFVQPEWFGLKYTDNDGELKTPVMIHFALLGSIERFLAAYIEHTAGRFPIWLAPEQVRIITVNQEKDVVEYANTIKTKAKDFGLRIEVDDNNESVGKKIRESELMKVPYTVVIGQKEIKEKTITPRVRSDIRNSIENDKTISIEEFLSSVKEEAITRTNKSVL